VHNGQQNIQKLLLTTNFVGTPVLPQDVSGHVGNCDGQVAFRARRGGPFKGYLHETAIFLPYGTT
jgi:hypothetical protein